MLGLRRGLGSSSPHERKHQKPSDAAGRAIAAAARQLEPGAGVGTGKSDLDAVGNAIAVGICVVGIGAVDVRLVAVGEPIAVAVRIEEVWYPVAVDILQAFILIEQAIAVSVRI